MSFLNLARSAGVCAMANRGGRELVDSGVLPLKAWSYVRKKCTPQVPHLELGRYRGKNLVLNICKIIGYHTVGKM